MDSRSLGGSTHVGKYRLVRELGRGGMGVVYLAEDTRLQRLIALKILHPFLSMDQEFVRRFTSEARAIAALAHNGIVRVHAFEEVDGSHLIDMEYIEGGSLDHLLASGHCSRAHALATALRVFEALAACHAQGIIHRDIKPSNILMASDGRVLLSDFGLARSCSRASASTASSSSFIGTPKYAAPETWGKASPAPAGDVYSAALVLLELLAGKTPYDGDSPLEIMRKTILLPNISVRVLLDDVSEDLLALLDEMLAAEPARRPADAGIALARLRAVPEFMDLSDDSSETIRVTPIRLRRQNAPRAGRVLVGLVVAALAVALFSGFAWKLRPTPIISPSGRTKTLTAPVAATAPPAAPDPAFLAAVGNDVVFVANAGPWRSLWTWDTATGKSVPLWPALSLEPEDDLFCPYPVKNGIVAVIRSPQNGLTLFFTDGTPANTAPLAFAASKDANRIEVLAAHEGKAWFNRIGGDGTFGLWETDGTLAGTRHVWGDKDHPIFDDVVVSPGGSVYFGSIATRTLHVLPAGQQEPIHLGPPTALNIEVIDLVGVGEGVLAEVSDGESGRELYAATTAPDSLHLLQEFIPGEAHGLTKPQFAGFGELAVFVAQTPEFGFEPWISDGTPEGTHLLFDANPGAGPSDPNRFTESGGRLFFSAQTAAEGRELWISDGTTTGTRMLLDLAPGLESSTPHDFVPFNSGLFFSATDRDHGEELWFTDGSPEGTRLVRDCMPGPDGGEPFKGVLVGDQLWFSAIAPGIGRTLWKSDGTPEGTRPLFDALEGKASPLPAPAAWAMFQDQIYIATATPDLGAEPWVVLPGSGESRLLRDIHPGPESSNPSSFFVFDGELYFVANDGIHGKELWRTNGTEAGTTLAFDALWGPGDGNPEEFVLHEDFNFAFLATSEICRTVHVFEAGTREFHVVLPPDHFRGPWAPSHLERIPYFWYGFSVQTASGETTLWKSNGGKPERIPGLGTRHQIKHSD